MLAHKYSLHVCMCDVYFRINRLLCFVGAVIIGQTLITVIQSLYLDGIGHPILR